MKELIIVDKTHLDLGFTDTAENVRRRYLTSFIPAAIDTAEKVNDGAEKKFVWTTGAWLIKEALESGGELSRRTEKALKDGNIAAHAFPFTTHTELMDCDLLEYGLSIIDRIDEVSGRKTIAAKMTDVPGHTAAVVPMLAKHGIKLLHIGTNTAAARPDVPNLFLWKFGGAEVVVIYSDGYGGMFSSPLTDKILYLDNAADNYGVRKPSAILRRFRRFQKQYPDYTVRAGRLDDIAENLWAVRDKLPVITDEIGDTWIHGAASDPYKTAALRTLNRLKQKWLAQGDIVRDSDAYRKFSDALLCITEHTWGGDMKVTLEDTEHYRKDKFVKAHKRDIVKFHNIFGDFPFRFLAFFGKAACKKEYSYSKIERTWTEQREYLEKAMSALPCTCKKGSRTLSFCLTSRHAGLSGMHRRLRNGDSSPYGKIHSFRQCKGRRGPDVRERMCSRRRLPPSCPLHLLRKGRFRLLRKALFASHRRLGGFRQSPSGTETRGLPLRDIRLRHHKRVLQNRRTGDENPAEYEMRPDRLRMSGRAETRYGAVSPYGNGIVA